MKIIRHPRITTILSVSLVIVGVITLISYFLPGGGIPIGLPLLITLLGAVVTFLTQALPEKYPWAAWMYLPGCLLIVLGIILLINVLTGDWKSWAYAWLLLIAGAGIGSIFTGQRLQWPDGTLLICSGTSLLSLTLFALFGAIGGGSFIQIMTPILLIAGGLSLRWTRIGKLIGERLSTARPPQNPEARQPDGILSSRNLRDPLSERELEVLALIDQGLSNAEIADRLTLAQSTVKTHINNIFTKLTVRTRAQAIQRGRALSILGGPPSKILP